MYQFISKSEQDTIEFAEKFASMLKQKDIIVLSGELRFWENKVCSRYFKIF